MEFAHIHEISTKEVFDAREDCSLTFIHARESCIEMLPQACEDHTLVPVLAWESDDEVFLNTQASRFLTFMNAWEHNVFA